MKIEDVHADEESSPKAQQEFLKNLKKSTEEMEVRLERLSTLKPLEKVPTRRHGLRYDEYVHPNLERSQAFIGIRIEERALADCLEYEFSEDDHRLPFEFGIRTGLCTPLVEITDGDDRDGNTKEVTVVHLVSAAHDGNDKQVMAALKITGRTFKDLEIFYPQPYDFDRYDAVDDDDGDADDDDGDDDEIN